MCKKIALLEMEKGFGSVSLCISVTDRANPRPQLFAIFQQMWQWSRRVAGATLWEIDPWAGLMSYKFPRIEINTKMRMKMRMARMIMKLVTMKLDYSIIQFDACAGTLLWHLFTPTSLWLLVGSSIVKSSNSQRQNWEMKTKHYLPTQNYIEPDLISFYKSKWA